MGTFTRVMRYLFRYWPWVLASYAVIIILSYLQAILPIIIVRDTVDVVLIGQQIDRLPFFITLVLMIYAIRSVLSFIGRYLQSYFSQKTMFDIRADIFDSVQKKSFSFYDRTQTGQLMARMTGDVEAINRLYSFFGQQLIGPISTALFSINFLLSIDARLAALCAASMPIILGINYLYRLKVEPLWSQVRESWARINTTLQEFLVGMKVVRVFTREELEEGKFEKVNKAYYEANVNVAKARSVFEPLNDFVLGLAIAGVYWYGGGETIGGTLTIGGLLVFSRYINILLQPIRMLSFFVSSYSRGITGANRIFEIMDAESDIHDQEGAVELPSIKGDVEFGHVSFAYDDERMVLQDIDLSVKAGETVAILGATGSGKSSLLYLISRFYDVTKGKLTLDGYDVREVTLRSLRKQIGIVLQDVFLFSTTIRDNIAFGRSDATEEKIIEAAKAAQAHDFIMAFPNGYDTIVGERGVTLSGGQKQSVAIARTLLFDPRILIFDDSTSFVDTHTEEQLQKALDALLEGRTTFIITQRLSTIKNADKIVVLNNGRIAEIGTHDGLLKLNGIYAKIYRTQFAPREELLAFSKQGLGGP